MNIHSNPDIQMEAFGESNSGRTWNLSNRYDVSISIWRSQAQTIARFRIRPDSRIVHGWLSARKALIRSSRGGSPADFETTTCAKSYHPHGQPYFKPTL